MKKKIIIIIILVLLLLGGLFLVFYKKEEPKKEEEQKVEQAQEPEKPKLQIIDVDSNSRSIAVMINNHAQARPNHAGLQSAYLMYEIVVEGGITRMMAVFKDIDIERIGSVRSARPYFLDYVLENDAIYVHYGYSEKAKNDIAMLGINNINGLYDEAFWRDKTLNVNYEHTAFTSTEKIKSVISSKKYRDTTKQDTLLNYSVEPVDISSKEGAIVANEVVIPYSYYMTTSYTYDATNNYYLRFANSVPHTDAITKEQYHFKNVIVVNIENYTTTEGDGRQALNNIGNGNGYFITNGYAVPITWEKSSQSNQTIYRYLDGEEITVNDGNTFIQIQPIDKVTTIS